MGYNAYANLMIGIAIDIEKHVQTVLSTDRYCNRHGLVTSAYCPDCGQKALSKKSYVASPALQALGFNPVSDGPDIKTQVQRWVSEHCDEYGMHLHCIDAEDSGEDFIRDYGIGYMLGSISQSRSSGDISPSIDNLKEKAQRIADFAAEHGISGDVRVYLQLYHSF